MTDSPDSPLSPAVVFGHEFDLATLGRPADEFERRFLELLSLAADDASDWYGIEDAQVTGNWSLVTRRELRQCRQREQERMFGRMLVPNDPTRDAREGDAEAVVIPEDAKPSGGVSEDQPRAGAGGARESNAGKANAGPSPSSSVEPGESVGTEESAASPTSQSPPNTPPAGCEPPRTSFEDETIGERRIVKRIKLDVLGKLPGGAIKVFSLYHRRTEIIRNIGKMTYEDLLQIAGPPAREYVIKSIQDDIPDVYSFAEVREAIAILAGFRTIGDQTELGVGCWEGVENARDGEMSVVLVGAGEAAYWNGDKKLYRIDYPRAKGHLLDFESGEESWYDYERLAKLLEEMTPEQCSKVKDECVELFGKWRWKTQSAPDVAAGLVFSTFVQSFWEWRPQVAVTGESNSGKSFLWNALEGIFGKLVIKASKPSAAGIRQAIGRTSKPVLIDEFEHERHRVEILEMLRASSRGDKILRGTPNQKGQEFRLRHIAWVAAIEVGLQREPDKNRFVNLELMKPRSEDAGKLTLPTLTELGDLGQRMLAVAIKSIEKARPLAMVLRDVRVPGVDPRIVESYAVPAAMLATIDGLDETGARRVLEDFLMELDSDEIEVDVDKQAILSDIMATHIQSGRDRLTVAQWLDFIVRQDNRAAEAEIVLGGSGIKLDSYTELEQKKITDCPDYCLEGSPCILLGHRNISTKLLRGTRWDGQNIDKILMRIPNATRSKRYIGKQGQRCVVIPMKFMRDEILCEDQSGPIF